MHANKWIVQGKPRVAMIYHNMLAVAALRDVSVRPANASSWRAGWCTRCGKLVDGINETADTKFVVLKAFILFSD